MIIETLDESVTVSTEIDKANLNKDSFDIVTPDFMLRVEYFDSDGWQVINAVDGLGNNCKDLFKGALVEFF